MTCSVRLRIARSVEEWELQRDSECRKGLELQRDSRYRKGLELQRYSACRKELELQRESRSGFKRNRAVCRMHSETRPVGKNYEGRV